MMDDYQMIVHLVDVIDGSCKRSESDWSAKMIQLITDLKAEMKKCHV